MENAKVKLTDPIHSSFRKEGICIWVIVNIICLLPVALPILWESGARKDVFFSSLLAYLFALIIGLIFNFMKTLWKPRAELIFWGSFMYVLFLISLFLIFNYERRINMFISRDIGLYAILISLISGLFLLKLNTHNFDAWAEEKYKTYLMNKANGIPLRKEFTGMKKALNKGI